MRVRKTVAAICTLIAVICMSMVSCGTGKGGSSAAEGGAFADRELADVSAYSGLEDYDRESVFVDITVSEMHEMIESGDTFVVFFSFESCPYCNRLIPYLNDAALDAGVRVGYINTRKNPSWQSNTDIDDYDLVEKHFAEWLEKDDDGRAHLYVPDVYFIKEGKVVARHVGVTPGADDPGQPLTSAQEKQIRSDLAEEFRTVL